MAGFGEGTHWFRNLLEQPRIEIIMPGGPLSGIAEDVTQSEEALNILRQILKNSGFAGYFAGFNPSTVSDVNLREKMKNYPLVCISPTGIGSGAGDAGGWHWILSLVLTGLFIWLVFR